MSNLETQIEQVQQRLRDLQARVRKQQRKDETRRLILYGAAATALAEEFEGDQRDRFLKRLHAKITRGSDRDFLRLPAKKVPSE